MQKQALLDIKRVIKEIAKQIPESVKKGELGLYDLRLASGEATMVKAIDTYLDNWNPEEQANL